MSEDNMRKLDRLFNAIVVAAVAFAIFALVLGDSQCSVRIKSESTNTNTPAR